MGRDLQKKKRRSGRQPIRQSSKPKKALNPRGNNVVAENWDKKATLAQNYRRLGLVARLKAPAGGVEKKLHGPAPKKTSKTDPFTIASLDKAIISEARVERDENGKIIRVLHRSTRQNPLNDPLNELEEGSDVEDDAPEDAWGGIDEEPSTDVVKALLEESRNPAEKKPRHVSEREREWLESLVAKHGDDTRAMARDARLNPMQQTAADIAKRLKKMNA